MSEILGIGTDITEIARIEQMLVKHGPSFRSLVFTAMEQGYCDGRKMSGESYAARWCAKEAILKALGTGWSNGIRWTDIEIRSLPSGQPVVAIGGRIAEMARQLDFSDILITMSHCKTYATATAMIVQSNEPFDDDRIIQ